MSQRDEEVRFAKKQQWYVTTAAVTLTAAIFALADRIHLTACEKGFAVAALAAIVVFGFKILRSLQKHIVATRPKNDQQPWWKSRGAEIMWPLAGVVALSALAVAYAIMWRLQTGA